MKKQAPLHSCTPLSSLAARWLGRCTLLGSFVLIQGCYVTPRQLWSQADGHYAEVRLKDWGESIAQREGTLRVVMVHGMNNHPFGINGDVPNLGDAKTYAGLQASLGQWDAQTEKWRNERITEALANGWPELVQQMASKYGHSLGEPGGDVRTFDLVREPGSGKVLGYVLTREFPAAQDKTGIKFYIANWALSTAVVKERQFGSWGLLTAKPGETDGYIEGKSSEMDTELNSQRALVNKGLKLHIINWGLGDPPLYLTNAGAPVRRVVATAFKQMASEATLRDRAAIIAASLGSTVALDCTTAYLNGSAPDGVTGWSWGGNAERSRTALFSQAETSIPGRTPAKAAIYLFANQWALLNMGRETKKDASPAQALQKLDAALATTTKRSGEKSIVQIYAFTDPNDLLSYPLNPDIKNASTCNVYVRNYALNPLWIAVNPGEAHTNYERNPKVLVAMFNGPDGVRLPK